MNPEGLRRECIELMVEADDGHPGSVMSIVEIVAGLDIDFRKDLLIISKGHAGMVIYPLLKEQGLITHDDLMQFRKPGALLTMFPNKSIPGVPVSCGSLGNGLGYGCGFALADRSKRVVVIISEGELYEGSTWEALIFAKHHNLTNMKVIVDKNDAIILGRPDDCLAIPWEALAPFRFVQVVKTIKGKGVPLWEGKVESHYWTRPNATA